MKILRGARSKRWGTNTYPDDDPVTIKIRSSDGLMLAELRRWQVGENILLPERENVTWCKGWGGSAAKALEVLVVLDMCVP